MRTLLIVNIAAFFAGAILDRLTARSFTWIFGLSVAGLRHGYLWQLVTYMFLHGPPWHLLMNMLVLFFIGPETERTMGTRHFLALYFVSGVLGGLGWILISPSGLPCVGASGAIFGILGAFAALHPHRPITLLLFFVLPITMKAWILVAGLALLELAALVTGHGGHVAYAAHVSGVVAGYVYAWVAFRQESLVWKWKRWRPAGRATRAASEVDRILDKIARDGVRSLTAKERAILEEASRRRRGRG